MVGKGRVIVEYGHRNRRQCCRGAPCAREKSGAPQGRVVVAFLFGKACILEHEQHVGAPKS